MLQAASTLSTSPVSFPLISETAIGSTTVQTVNARDLHAFLEVRTSFKDWIARRVEEYGFQEENDFCSFLSESSGGRPAKEYAITLDMAKELSMVERNARGKEARRYFIACERKLMEQKLAAPQAPVIQQGDVIPAFALSDGAAMAVGLLMTSGYRQTFNQLRHRMRARKVRDQDIDRAIEELCDLGLVQVSLRAGTHVQDVVLVTEPALGPTTPAALPAPQPVEDCPVACLIPLLNELIENHFDQYDGEQGVAVCTVIGQLEMRATQMKATSLEGQLFQMVLLNGVVEDLLSGISHGPLEARADGGLSMCASLIGQIMESGAHLPTRMADYYGVKQAA